jgi:hypothetical protein
MIRIGLLAALVAAAAAAHAQPQRPDTAVPSAATETRVEPSGALTGTAPPPLLDQSPARPQSDVDARHCLDLATNAQVHRCAEPFRPRLAQSKSKAPPQK